ncbi:hypothetical protein PIB30_064383 [Stylosanthes scabra]|uniref:Uncharacterized protein n=1 Tax=Stylosanthes scabra TaxID=79078 RepID=A0ABU6QM56_9FABA|nr:hypothetical protein [Stylosanthes scabra]
MQNMKILKVQRKGKEQLIPIWPRRRALPCPNLSHECSELELSWELRIAWKRLRKALGARVHEEKPKRENRAPVWPHACFMRPHRSLGVSRKCL